MKFDFMVLRLVAAVKLKSINWMEYATTYCHNSEHKLGFRKIKSVDDDLEANHKIQLLFNFRAY